MTNPRSSESAPGPAVSASATYRRRALLGNVALTLRTAVAQLVILGGTIVLARHLSPSDFGTFAMVQFVLVVLTIVGDAGLGGALVQKKTPPSQSELSSVFFVQMALAFVVVLAASLVGEALPRIWTDLPEGTPWIVRALALNYVLTSARVVPTLLMERELLFVRISILDTVNSVVFYLVASAFALADFGVWALVYGVVGQGVAGLFTALALRPWWPSLAFDRMALRGLLGFGIPYQARSGLVLLTRSAIPVVGGTMVGSHAVGLVNWALETGFFALTFVEILARVSFPLYSRLQTAAAELAAEIERTLRVGAAIALFLAGMFVGLGPELTEIIYSAQWLEAVPLLRAYAVAVVFGMLVFLLAPAFDAANKPRIVLAQMTVVCLLTWIATPLGVRFAGALKLAPAEGFVAAHALALAVGAFVIARAARRELPRIRLIRIFAVPSAAAVAIAWLGASVLGPRVESPFALFGAVVFEAALFLGLLALFDRDGFAALRASLPRTEPRGSNAEAGSAAPADAHVPESPTHRTPCEEGP